MHDAIRFFGNSTFSLRTQVAQELHAFNRDGFMILRGALQKDAVAALQQALDNEVWAPDPRRRPDVWLGITNPGAYVENKSIYVPFAGRLRRRHRYRIPKIHEVPHSVWSALVHDEELLAVVQELIGGPPKTILSNLMEWGTMQGMHDDTWHGVTSETPGGMVGVWVSLDHVNADNGPLSYLPGSHTLPEIAHNPSGRTRLERLRIPVYPEWYQYYVYENMRKWVQDALRSGYKERKFLAAPGDIAIWKEHLIHGGSQVVDRRQQRRSLVLHYIL